MVAAGFHNPGRKKAEFAKQKPAEVMDVDEEPPLPPTKPRTQPLPPTQPETQLPPKPFVYIETGNVGGNKGKGKSKAVSDKARRELGEAEYDPELSPADYRDGPVGGKHKPAESGRKGKGAKRVKSAPVVDSSEESESEAEVIRKPPAKAPASKPGASKAGREPRSTFGKYLPARTLEFLEDVKARGQAKQWDAREVEEYNSWFQEQVLQNPALKPSKKARTNQPPAIMLMGKTLTPPEGLQKSAVICDYCAKFCPHRCFVLDQGTSCVMCNFFRRCVCETDGKPVMEATRTKHAVKAPKNSGPAKPKTTAPKQPKNPGDLGG
ncbi:hypothetical protein MD484_g8912, partial [Candolleomyces efflorescens]